MALTPRGARGPEAARPPRCAHALSAEASAWQQHRGRTKRNTNYKQERVCSTRGQELGTKLTLRA
eukprot:9080788-Lingulodinium_polyedra.AAC.1